MSRLLFVFLAIAILLNPPVHSEQATQESNIRPSRPQEPNHPYPYSEEQLTFTNIAAEITLAGTLTLPNTPGPFPAVILLHGSAPLDRDSSLFGHKPFLVWADHLTRQGIAVLRFDKRSAGKSTGNYDTSTIEDFASDALAAVAYLKTRREILTHQIGLIGHSEGGITASMAASKSKDVAFVVLMATPTVNAENLTYVQEANLQSIDGIDKKTVTETQKFREDMFFVLKNESKETAEDKLHSLFQKNAIAKEVIEKYYGPLERQIKFFNSTAFRFWMRFEPSSLFKQLAIPVLALHGELDLIVSPEQNRKKEIPYKDYTSILFPNVNHMFQTCKTSSISEYAIIEETTAPQVLRTMSKWILERTHKRD